jgi:hypothetical protein
VTVLPPRRLLEETLHNAMVLAKGASNNDKNGNRALQQENKKLG